MSNVDLDATNDKLREFVSEVADAQGFTTQQAADQLEVAFGLDISEVDDDEAEAFVDACNDGDTETIREILEGQGIEDDTIDQFIDTIAPPEGNGDGAAEGNAEAADSGTETDTGQSQGSTDGDGLTAAQRQEVQELVPSADEIASSLQSQMGGGGGGGGAQAAQEAAGGQLNPEMQQRIAMKLIDNFMDSGGGGAHPMAEKATEKAMERAYTRMAQPSLGERIGEAIEANLAEQVGASITDGVELEAGDMFGENNADGESEESESTESDDDGDGESGVATV